MLHGLESGSIVALFTDPRQTAAQAKGHAELREVSATESLLRPIREYPCPFVNGTPECRDGGSDVLDGARYARLLAPPRDFALTVSSPRLAKGASAAQRSLAEQTHAAITVPSESRKAQPQRLRFADEEPDLIWWVTPQGFRLAPAGVDVAAFQTGAGVTITDAIPADDRRTATLRAIERAYRVERLRRMAAQDTAGADEPRVELRINARSDVTRSADCPAGSGAPRDTADGARAQPCSQIMVRVTNTSAAPRYVHVFLIDSDWNIRQVMNRESNVRLGCTVRHQRHRRNPGGARNSRLRTDPLRPRRRHGGPQRRQRLGLQRARAVDTGARRHVTARLRQYRRPQQRRAGHHAG